jgi:hypothetical protein
MRLNDIRILVGDSVTLEISTYDLARGRIVHRGKKDKDKSRDDKDRKSKSKPESEPESE